MKLKELQCHQRRLMALQFFAIHIETNQSGFLFIVLHLMTVEGGVIVRNYLKDEVDLRSGSMCLLTGL